MSLLRALVEKQKKASFTCLSWCKYTVDFGDVQVCELVGGPYGKELGGKRLHCRCLQPIRMDFCILPITDRSFYRPIPPFFLRIYKGKQCTESQRNRCSQDRDCGWLLLLRYSLTKLEQNDHACIISCFTGQIIGIMSKDMLMACWGNVWI